MATKGSRKKGFQPPGAGGGQAMLAPALAAVAAAAMTASLMTFTLKSSLIKPGRIVAAADDSGLIDKLPRIMFMVVIEQGSFDVVKRLGLEESEIQTLALEAFPVDWVAEEVEAIVYDLTDSIKSGEHIPIALELEPIKGDLTSALIGVIRANVDKVPLCGGGQDPSRNLCKPKNVDDFTFQNGVDQAVRAAIGAIPNQYPLLRGPSAQAIQSLKGALGTMGTAGILLFLVALGAAGGAYAKREEAETNPLKWAGIGFGVAGVGLLLVVFSIKGAVLGGIEGAVATLEASVAKTINEFLAVGIGGGFTTVYFVLIVCAALGGGLYYMAMRAE